MEVAEPGLVFVPLQGAVRYYGSEAEVIERVHSVVGPHGGRIGVAGGPSPPGAPLPPWQMAV